jgi:chromosome segregation ATPase
MTNRAGVIVLAVICVALGIWSITVTKNASKERTETSQTISTLSNKWEKASADLEEQKKVADEMEKDVEAQKKTVAELTNSYAQATSDLARAEASLKASQEEIKQRETKIAQLEEQNQDLEGQASQLGTAITNLNVEIAQTQRRLAASEGDKAFLERELKRMMSEKSELERQFNDLTVLRAQVARIKEEINVARRLDWMRRGLYASAEQKGAQKLLQAVNPPPKAARPNYDLNVEVSADGSVKIVPPATNAPSIVR